MTLTTPPLAAKGTVPAGAFFGVAGCVVSSSGMKGVVRAMHKAKATAGLQPDDPVKHSMDNEIRRIYLDLYGAKNGDAQYKAARSSSKAIGRAALGNVPPPVAPAPRSRHLRRVRSPAMGIFLIGVWLGTFLGIVVAGLLRAAAEHDLTG